MFQTTKEKFLGLVWWEGGSPPYGAFGTASQKICEIPKWLVHLRNKSYVKSMKIFDVHMVLKDFPRNKKQQLAQHTKKTLYFSRSPTPPTPPPPRQSHLFFKDLDLKEARINGLVYWGDISPTDPTHWFTLIYWFWEFKGTPPPKPPPPKK